MTEEQPADRPGGERAQDDGAERTPISWEALAAELAATREEDERRDRTDPSIWDTVAAELAARVAERPAPAPERDAEPVPVPAPLPPPTTAPPSRTPPSDLPPGGIPPHDAARPPRTGPVTSAAGEEVPEPEPDPATLRGGLEALLFVVDTPVGEMELAGAMRCRVDRVRTALDELATGYDERGAGITLRRVGEGWRLYTREEHAEVVERYLHDGQRSRLTQAALETLAVIAYRQPVTRARVSAIRGVGVDGVMRTLINRGLVHEVGADPDSGGGLYATTPLFLERLGLTGLDELPDLGPLLPDTDAVLAEHPDV